MRWAPYSYRDDPAVPTFPDERPLFVFDGECVLCSGSARFLLRHDRQGRIRAAAAQSPLGRALYRHYGLDPKDLQTNMLLVDGQPLFKSDTALGAARLLGPPWSWLAALQAAPRPLRDRIYDFVARRRLRLFGRRDVCYLAEPGLEDRFLA